MPTKLFGSKLIGLVPFLAEREVAPFSETAADDFTVSLENLWTNKPN
jgi:hypothetical protein